MRCLELQHSNVRHQLFFFAIACLTSVYILSFWLHSQFGDKWTLRLWRLMRCLDLRILLATEVTFRACSCFTSMHISLGRRSYFFIYDLVKFRTFSPLKMYLLTRAQSVLKFTYFWMCLWKTSLRFVKHTSGCNLINHPVWFCLRYH